MTKNYIQINKLVTAWQDTPDDTHYPSEKLVKDTVDTCQTFDNMIKDWDSATEDNYPNSSLVKDSLDGKQDSALITEWTAASNSNYPSGELVKTTLNDYELNANKVSSWSATVDNTHYPTEKLVKDTLDEKQAQHTTATATLTVAGWNSTTKQQQVSVSGVTASNTVIVSPSGSTYVDYGTAQVHVISQTTGALTFECTTIPSSPLTVNVVIME